MADARPTGRDAEFPEKVADPCDAAAAIFPRHAAVRVADGPAQTQDREDAGPGRMPREARRGAGQAESVFAAAAAVES